MLITPGKNCKHPTLPQLVLRQEITQETLQPEGAQVPPEHGRVFWGGNRLGVTPEVPSQQKQGTGTAGGVGTSK